ncbi:ATP-binding protein [Massilia violaceinigra]|uniref:ATP-binding protein n=1 Tax=Massilia violaceinigra TaxID=2045208 RepID=A0ABY4A834_9BURK|nr:ATP-binding protein [Massilia violaceinigra]UOD30871.1 ATP-binding protein [Massilia violaceinigra]
MLQNPAIVRFCCDFGAYKPPISPAIFNPPNKSALLSATTPKNFSSEKNCAKISFDQNGTTKRGMKMSTQLPNQSNALKAIANPSKSFFIAMLTRDIDLVDCMLDLLDNTVDGINSMAKRNEIVLDEEKPYHGFSVDITFDRSHFSIKDKSGGIPIDVATDYAFRFGRPDFAPDLLDGSIGLYGIGMKRAIFKIGNLVSIQSSTGFESFNVDLDVEKWRQNQQLRDDVEGNEVMEWSFDLTNVQTNGTDVEIGTIIRVEELYEGIYRQFENPIFQDRLNKMIARDYAFILNQGLTVRVNGVEIAPIMPKFLQSSEIAPFQHVEICDGVRIEITVGFAEPPPSDTSATARNPDVGVYGWYVVCNDRVVVSADKSADTGWGIKPVPAWHPQYIGFMGVVRFESSDPRKLPWKTTKRDVEASNAFYQRALPVMMRATKKLTDYTNARRLEAKRLKRIENAAVAKPVSRIIVNVPVKLPEVDQGEFVMIEYAREMSDVRAAAETLGIVGGSPSEVGIRTFEYYFAREVAK